MATQQLPPDIPPEVLAQMQQQQAPVEGPPVEGPPTAEQPPMEEMPPEAMMSGQGEPGLIQAESQALEMDDESANRIAVEIISSAKEDMYGDKFDTYMEVLQGSENIVEDLAMISIDLLMPEINAAETTTGIPYSYGMDIAAEVVSEAYDMAVQTGVYSPDNEEELERNQNITLTMVAGELGKEFGASGNLDESKVSGFIDNVLDGQLDDYADPNEMTGDMPTMAEAPPMPPEQMAPMPQEQMPPPAGQAVPMQQQGQIVPEEEQGLIRGGMPV